MIYNKVFTFCYDINWINVGDVALKKGKQPQPLITELWQFAVVSSELQPDQILLTEFRLPLNEIWRENCKVPLFVRVFFY